MDSSPSLVGDTLDPPYDISNDGQITQLKSLVFKYHLKAIGYIIYDIKGISTSSCTDRIHLEEEASPYVEHQRRLNLNMKEVVKNED